MVAQVIRGRLGDTPAVHEALNHDMFKSRKEIKAERDDCQEQNLVEIGNAVESDDSHKLSLTFELPHGVSLPALRESIVRGQQQIPIAAARTFSSALGIAA